MAEGTYEDGFRDGWEGIADGEPMPDTLPYPPEGEVRDYHAGFLYGRSEAALHYKPGTGTRDPVPRGL
jgi:hypothetical protein